MDWTDDARRLLDDRTRAAAQRSGLPPTQAEDGRLELLSHVHDAAESLAAKEGAHQVRRADVEAAFTRLGAPAAVTATFFQGSGPMTPAGFWRRAFAYGVDSVVVGLPVAMLSFATFFVFAGVAPLALTFFSAWAERKWGRTPGKALFGLQVVTRDGSELTWSKAINRNWTKVVWVAVLVDYLIGHKDAEWPGAKASDKVAGTMVVRRPKATGQPAHQAVTG